MILTLTFAYNFTIKRSAYKQKNNTNKKFQNYGARV